MIPAVFLGTLGICVLIVSAWMHINNKDGSGWGLVAFCLIVTSCGKVP